MPLYTTDGIVVGVRNWGETDRIVSAFTRERGLVEAGAYGARRPRSALAGPLQLFAEVELQIAEGHRLDTIRQATLIEPHRIFSTDITRMAYASFVAEVVRELMAIGQPDQGLYDTLREILRALEQRNPRITALAAAIEIIEFAGLQLSYERCVRCGREITGDAAISLLAGGAICTDCSNAADVQMPAAGQSTDLLPYPAATRELLIALRDYDWSAPPGSLHMKGSTLMAAERLIITYLCGLIDHPLKSLEFIQQITALDRVTGK